MNRVNRLCVTSWGETVWVSCAVGVGSYACEYRTGPDAGVKRTLSSPYPGMQPTSGELVYIYGDHGTAEMLRPYLETACNGFADACPEPDHYLAMNNG